MSTRAISIEINGRSYEGTVEPRLLLSDFIRHEAHLTGTNVGCEHGVCGACTVQLDGEPIRSCLMLAVQADGRCLRTVEGLAPPEGELHPLQQAFHETHALQCGFCTPGILCSATHFLRRNPSPDEAQVRDMLSGHICRCTGYAAIVFAILDAASNLRKQGP